MSNNKVVVQGGVGFPGLLFIVLLVCKLFGANITWFWVNNDGGYTIQDEGVYLKGELLGDPLDFLNVEQPKSYFY